mgnify:CR=1 FL=1
MAEKNVEVIDKESKQYIVVMVGSEQYGIDISYIDNIVRMQKITRVPKIQSYFKGVINLRGEIVSVMSIRNKMGLEDDVHERKPYHHLKAGRKGRDRCDCRRGEGSRQFK